MPYTALHQFDRAQEHVVEEVTGLRKLRADCEADAFAEADKWLRASRVLADIAGDRLPVAEVVMRDGQEIGRVSFTPTG